MDAVVYGKVAALEKKISKIITFKHEETAVALESGSQVSLPIETNTGKLILKTIYIKSLEGAAIDVEIVSSTDNENSFLFYRNAITTHELYDVVDIPYMDEDETNKLHLVLRNRGNIEAPYSIRISALFAQ